MGATEIRPRAQQAGRQSIMCAPVGGFLRPVYPPPPMAEGCHRAAWRVGVGLLTPRRPNAAPKQYAIPRGPRISLPYSCARRAARNVALTRPEKRPRARRRLRRRPPTQDPTAGWRRRRPPQDIGQSNVSPGRPARHTHGAPSIGARSARPAPRVGRRGSSGAT